LNLSLSSAQETHVRKCGFIIKRFSGISSPQSSHKPYSSASIFSKAHVILFSLRIFLSFKDVPIANIALP